MQSTDLERFRDEIRLWTLKQLYHLGFGHYGGSLAIMEALSERYPVLIKRIGVREQFGQMGKVEYLKEFYKITYRDIVKTVTEDC